MNRPELNKIGQSDTAVIDVVPPRNWGDDWVHELIEMTRPGAEINLQFRGLGDRAVPFQFDDFS
ncbi:hypothetical protein U1763_05070 [Sphingomonas sp. LB2R24]|uniref:hypothetical protein n=1 Tax=Sphingomonas sorbitolis TaxID=3096165 RepID=UPI002FC81ACB